MSRKKFVKKMMAIGQSRNIANKQSGLVNLVGNYDAAYQLCCCIILSAKNRVKG